MDVGIALPNAIPGATAGRADRVGAPRRGARLLHPGDDRPHRLRQLRAADRARRRGGGDRADRPLDHGAAGAAADQRRRAGQAGAQRQRALRRSADARRRARRREDDYEVSGVELKGRGRRLDAMLERMREIWDGDEVGPSPAGARASSSAATPTPPTPAPPASPTAGSPAARAPSRPRRAPSRRAPPGAPPAATARPTSWRSPTSRSASAPSEKSKTT